MLLLTMCHNVHATVGKCITMIMLQMTMYQTITLACPDNCQRKGSKNRTNFSYFPQKPAGSTLSLLEAFPPRFSLVTCFRPLAVTSARRVACSLLARYLLAASRWLSLRIALRLRQPLALALALAASHCAFGSLSRSLSLLVRRFAPAAASLRSGTPLRGYPSHFAALVGPSRSRSRGRLRRPEACRHPAVARRRCCMNSKVVEQGGEPMKRVSSTAKMGGK